MRKGKWDARLAQLDAKGMSDRDIATTLTTEGYRTAQGNVIDRHTVVQRRWYTKKTKPTLDVPAFVAELRAAGFFVRLRTALDEAWDNYEVEQRASRLGGEP